MEDIKRRFEIGYTMAVYGTRESLYEQMLKDINSLIGMNEALRIHDVRKSNSFDIHVCINDICDAVEAKIAYISPIKPKGNGAFRWRVKQAIDKMLYSR